MIKTSGVACRRVLLCLFAAVLASAGFFARPVSAALSVDNTSNANGGNSNITSLTWSHTVIDGGGSPNNAVLIVGVSARSGTPTVSSVTYGGTALTSLGTQPSPASTNRITMFYLLAPTAGTANIVVTLSAAANIAAGAVSFSGALQSAPTGFVSASGTSTTASVSTASSASGEFIVNTVAADGDATTLTAASGQVSLWNTGTGTAGGNVRAGGSYKKGTGSAVTTSWTLGASKAWSIGEVRVAPSNNSPFSLTRINIDDLYGVQDSASIEPFLSPVGVRVTNSGSTNPTDVGIQITVSGYPSNCGTGANLPCVTVSGPMSTGPTGSFINQSLPTSFTQDYYFIIKIENSGVKNQNTTPIGANFSYTVTVSSSGVSDISVASPSEVVDYLQAQNRNTTAFTTGTGACGSGISVHQFAEFQCTVLTSTGGSGSNFDTMRIWQDWDGNSFVIDNVQTYYGGTTVNGNEFTPPSADCSGGCGGTQTGNITQTLTLRAVGAPGLYTIKPFVLDTSGGSHHVNSGNGTPALITITGPTAVKLRSFDVEHQGEDNIISWRTGREVSNLGFRIYRDDPQGRVTVTPELVAGSALFTAHNLELSSGRSYRFVDRKAPTGATYYLEDVDLNGTTVLEGPVLAEEGGISPQPVVSTRAAAPGDGNSPYVSEISFGNANSKKGPSGFSAPSRKESKPAATNSSTQNRQFSLAGQAGMKVLVRDKGWYRISHQDLTNAGWDPGSVSTNLQLYVEGQPIPMLVTDLGGGNYTMEFYGTGLDTVSTDTRVYWIALNSTAGSRLASKSVGSGTSAGADFPFTVQRKDRLVYAPGIPNGDAESWFGKILWPATPIDESIVVTHLNTTSSGSATLDVVFQGASSGVTHEISISVNGNPAGTISFPDIQNYETTVAVPVGWLVEGTNTIQFSNLVDGDYPLADFERLTYPHLFTADQDALELSVSGGQQITIGGFTVPGVRVFDITNPSAVNVLSGSVVPSGGGFALTISTPAVVGTLRLLAVADDRVGSPAALAANNPSSWNKTNNRADLVTIAYPSFLPAIGPLASLRQSQGLATDVVDVTDIYDEFSFGEKDPAAVKTFLQWTKANWKKAPGYVLLVGDGSFDPRDYAVVYGFGPSDFMPAKLVPSVFLKTASDDWYVDFNNDGLPDMAIGRLPVDTLAQANTVVSKIVGYDSTSAGNGVFLMADTNDENDFRGAVSGLVPLVGGGKTPHTLCVGGSTDNINGVPCVDAGTAQAQIVNAFNGGQSLVNWVGHGEETSWSKSDVFNTSDIPGLASGALPVVVAMDCLNGYFQDLTTQTLAESLLENPNGGAAAVWASSALTLFESQVPVNQALFQQLFVSPAPRIGDAMVAAKAATTDPDVRKTWVLFGDPTMKFK